MTARKKRAAKKVGTPASPITLSKVIDECVAGLSMIEVTARALEENQSAVAEQLVLERALKTLSSVYNYLSDLPDAGGGGDPDQPE
jgi:hypothetical protein